MRRHTEWVIGRVQNVKGLASKTFKTAAPSGTKPPYAIVHPQDGQDDSDRLTGAYTVLHPFHTIHLVHTTADGAQRLGEDLKAEFVQNGFGITPDIPDEVCSLVSYGVPRAIEVDRDVTPWEYFHTSEVSFDADPL